MKLNKLFGMGLLCLNLIGAITVYGQSIGQDPLITTGRLSNGLSYYIRKSTAKKDKVVMFLANKVGSNLESEEQLGLAHFIEHMSFNGSKHFPGNSLVDFLEKAGVRFGADLNAYTNFDETVYQLPLSVTDPKMLKSGLQVLRDWASEATLDPKEIDQERGVILEEKRLRGGAEHRMNEQYFPMLVNHSRYAFRSPIGSEQVLKNFKHETLKNFYKDWYRPDLQAIIVVGDVNVGQVKQSIEKMFSDLKNPLKQKPRPDYGIKLYGENQFAAITDAEAQSTTLRVHIKHLHKTIRTAEDYRSEMVKSLFNQMISTRFMEISKDNSENYLSAGASIGGLVANIDAFTASVTARPAELQKGFETLWSQITAIKKNGFTNEELRFAKIQYHARINVMLKEEASIDPTQFAQEYLGSFFSGETIPGFRKQAELTAKYLDGITTQDLLQCAKAYIVAKNRDVIITAPTLYKSSLPDKKAMDKWFILTEQQEISNKKPGLIVEDVKTPDRLLFLPFSNISKVVSSKFITELGITELRLANGIKVVLKPTSYKNDEISFMAFSPGGTSLYADADYQSAINAASIVSNGGCGNYSAEQLRIKLNGIQANVNTFISERFEGAMGGSSTADLETALQLLYLKLVQPKKDADMFSAAMSRTKAAMTSSIPTPEKMFSDTLSAVLGNYSIRRKAPEISDIKQIDLDRAFQIYKERFSNLGDLTFIMVGNFDPIAVQPLLAQYLGALPASQNSEAPKDLAIEIPTGQIKKLLHSGSGNKAMVSLVISGDYNFSPESNLELRALKYIIQLRMIARLREKEGGVYSISTNMASSKSPRSRYSFSVQFGCAPENTDKLIAAVWDEIEKLKQEGPAVDDIQKFIAEEKVVLKGQLETNAFWLGYLNNQYQENLDPRNLLTYNVRLDALKAQKLQLAFIKYVAVENYIQVVMLPENTKL